MREKDKAVSPWGDWTAGPSERQARHISGGSPALTFLDSFVRASDAHKGALILTAEADPRKRKGADD